MRARLICLLLAPLASPLLLAPARAQDEAITPPETLDFLADPEFHEFTHHLNPQRSLTTERDEVWSMTEDGRLHVSGRGWGYLRGNFPYRDYHLVLEYQWGEHTWAARADGARDCGLLIHGFGQDGAFAGSWLNGFEVQLLEGGTGNLVALAFQNRGEEKPPTALSALARATDEGETWWSPDGEPVTLPAADQRATRLNWQHRDPSWTDCKGYRGADDIENPVGEWNRLEVICRRDSIEVRLNGEKVNEATDVVPAEGFVGLQSEGAECWIRRWELWPLDTFDETWTPEQRSTDTGYTASGESILPRRFPLSPEESAAAWKIHGDYEIQLVAAEPLVCDPVDVVWDEHGRMFVAEMRDYPLPPESQPYLSRIRLLSDSDGDGRMDTATTWADGLDHVQGLLPIDGGLLATTRTAILFLKDTDGDDVADEITELFEQNEPRHNQLQVSCPRWGLDNAIYLNNGLDLKEIYPADAPDEKLAASGVNLRYDPRSRELTTVSGRGQFGGSLDNWNRRFFATNRNPLIFAVMPLDAAERNPYAAITAVQEDIDAPGAKLRPLLLSHTTSAAHAGTYTAACGLGVYRGHLLPEMTGDVFVCDPTAQVVTRNRLRPAGASFTVERIHGEHEFLASDDEWTRPVHIRNGPDGALYLCDMYRRFIDHARFFPEDFQNTNYMRAGFDHGRIWRVVPKGHTDPPAAVEALPTDPLELVALLDHPNAWQRIHAQRLLVAAGDSTITPAIVPILGHSKRPESRVQALWTLHGLDALSERSLATALADPHDGVVENAIALADPQRDREALLTIAHAGHERASYLAVLALGDDPGDDVTEAFTTLLFNRPARIDPWMRKAVLSGSKDRAGAILAEMMKRHRGPMVVTGSWDAESYYDCLREFAAAVAARGDDAELAAIFDAFAHPEAPAGERWRFAFAEGLANGLKRGKLKQRTLAAFIAAPPEGLVQNVAALRAVVDSAQAIVVDRERNDTDRIAALPLASQQGEEAMFAIVDQLIDPRESAALQAAACQALSGFNRTTVAEFFFERWDRLGPTPLREALTLIAANANSGLLLMKKMQAGEINKSLMPAMQRWSYARSSNEEVKALALELFGRADDDRARVIGDFRTSLPNHQGDADRGRAVFEKAACMTCHKVGDVGVDVGPGLADVRIKPAEALLTDILDPNRAVEERWASYTLTTSDGRSLTGLVTGETAEAVQITLPGGLSETVPRVQIASLETTGLSLMPVGLEAAITEQDMADLLAFLKEG